jgi:hypothetical protein
VFVVKGLLRVVGAHCMTKRTCPQFAYLGNVRNLSSPPCAISRVSEKLSDHLLRCSICESMSTECSQLPACSKCRTRKVRCDRQAPKCGNCTKGNVACIIVDPVTGEQYARDFVYQLEQEEARLKAHFEHAMSQSGAGTLRSETTERTPRGPLTGETVATHNGFVGDGSGLG